MSKILEHDVFKQYLEKYGKGKIDLKNTDIQLFLKQFAGAILMLVPEASCFLVENGLEDDTEVSFLAMAALGATLKDVGEKELEAIRLEKELDHEKVTTLCPLVRTRHKLCQ